MRINKHGVDWDYSIVFYKISLKIVKLFLHSANLPGYLFWYFVPIVFCIEKCSECVRWECVFIWISLCGFGRVCGRVCVCVNASDHATGGNTKESRVRRHLGLMNETPKILWLATSWIHQQTTSMSSLFPRKPESVLVEIERRRKKKRNPMGHRNTLGSRVLLLSLKVWTITGVKLWNNASFASPFRDKNSFPYCMYKMQAIIG